MDEVITVLQHPAVVGAGDVSQMPLFCKQNSYVFVSSKVHMELVWPVGKVGPSGGPWVGEWASDQLPREAGVQGSPPPLLDVLTAVVKAQQTGPEVLRRAGGQASRGTCWIWGVGRVVVVFWEQQLFGGSVSSPNCWLLGSRFG